MFDFLISWQIPYNASPFMTRFRYRWKKEGMLIAWKELKMKRLSINKNPLSIIEFFLKHFAFAFIDVHHRLSFEIKILQVNFNFSLLSKSIDIEKILWSGISTNIEVYFYLKFRTIYNWNQYQTMKIFIRKLIENWYKYEIKLEYMQFISE